MTPPETTAELLHKLSKELPSKRALLIDGVPNAVQVPPPLVVYCQVAPNSSPLTFTRPLLVMPSLPELPVSLARANPGVVGGVASTAIVAALLVAVLVLPARSVCLTWMLPVT